MSEFVQAPSLGLQLVNHASHAPHYERPLSSSTKHAAGAARGLCRDEGWVLEFGPYAGYYDFDSRTNFVDRGLFGARASGGRAAHEIDEVGRRLIGRLQRPEQIPARAENGPTEEFLSSQMI